MKISKTERLQERAKRKSYFAAKQALKTILLLLIYLLFFSFAGNGIAVPGTSLVLSFKPYAELFTFKGPIENTKADALIASYLAGDKSADGSPTRENVFINPVHDGVSPLDNFFEALTSDAPHRLIRVAHYGDSQLEGDRITMQIRERLQKAFGGSGYGFVPISDIATPISYERTSTENLIKYNVFSQKLSAGIPYGLSGTAYKFVYQMNMKEGMTADSLRSDTATVATTQSDTIKRFSGASASFRFTRNKSFNTASLLFGRVTGPTEIAITGDNGIELFKGSLNDNISYQENELNRLVLPAEKMQRNCKITFAGDNSTVFYGLYLDPDKDVQVDNYSIRGHSGNGLLLLNEQFSRLQLQYLDTKLVILQYGGNTVPYIDNVKEKKYIKDMYSSVIMKIRKIIMAKAYEGEYRTYPGLTMVRDALRETALENGCAFWDVFEMMGGENSILKWSEKGLAAKDGHFSISGEEVVARELVKQIEREYAVYKKRKGDS
ncbi:MAG: hypothetical protein HYV28_11535 [Ignavibacteriales bacterium]|nr:hypothetical protein [Ignavibacteriales bacterium]